MSREPASPSGEPSHGASRTSIPSRVRFALRGRRLGFVTVAVLSGVWWIVAPRASGFAVAGLVGVAVGAALHAALGGPRGPALRPARLPGFVPWFLARAVDGGVDVARRAFSPSLPLAPDLLPYRLRLPQGSARVFFVNAISLLPGTFSTELKGDELTVHCLAREEGDEARLRALEERVAGLWDLTLEPGTASE